MEEYKPEKIEEQVKEFNIAVGQILVKAISIESQLEFFISNYFVKPQNSKTFFLNDAIILKLSFEKKIDIFKKICKWEGFDDKKLSDIVSSVRYIQEIRNRIAHWQSEMPEFKTVQLRKRKSFTTLKDIQKLDIETMKKVNDTFLKAINGIAEFYLKYSKEGTIDEKASWGVK
ncbi:hypothetical protein KY332_00615 [Candidatus Woesearchaeota archaeon]|nr:hypothetical protein [Candidatus Woesearchaeota archaeon]